jgi:hypothetical protein
MASATEMAALMSGTLANAATASLLRVAQHLGATAHCRIGCHLIHPALPGAVEQLRGAVVGQDGLGSLGADRRRTCTTLSASTALIAWSWSTCRPGL